jgi:pyruvate/2-oxoglutarate dehydrogenase complex dihydrolipoamide dehydrogenase (E3) component
MGSVSGWSARTVLAVDYDLVIIGNTFAARVAARQAAEWPARVALVMPQTANDAGAHLYPQALAQASLHATNRSPHYPWQYAKTAIEHLTMQSSLQALVTKGVDIIEGTGSFQRRPHLAFNTSRRSLRAKRFLLAMGSQPTFDYPIAGLSNAGFLTTATLPNVVSCAEIPRRWAIVGEEAIGVELAQSLRLLGYEVTLIVESERILPQEDPDVVAEVQFQLESTGVRLMTNATVAEAGLQDGSKYVIVNRRIIHVDEIFVAAIEQPLVDSFDLVAARVECDHGVSVDGKMETSNAQIYACGSVCGNVRGGYYGEHLAEYEAMIATHNALSRRSLIARYDRLPWTIFSEPQIARVGMTEVAARDRFQKRLMVVRAYYRDNPKALLAESDRGFVKLLVRYSGQIVGATIVGADASELTQAVALAVWRKISIESLAEFPGITLAHSRLLVEAARQWRKPSLWLRSIDPLRQLWADVVRSIMDFFDHLGNKPEKKVRQPRSSKTQAKSSAKSKSPVIETKAGKASAKKK